MSAVAVEHLDAEGLLGLLDDAPCLAVGHMHTLGGCIQGALLLDTAAKIGYAFAKDGLAAVLVIFDEQADLGGEFGKVAHGFPPFPFCLSQGVDESNSGIFYILGTGLDDLGKPNRERFQLRQADGDVIISGLFGDETVQRTTGEIRDFFA